MSFVFADKAQLLKQIAQVQELMSQAIKMKADKENTSKPADPEFEEKLGKLTENLEKLRDEL